MVTSKQNTHRGSVHLNKVWVILAIVVLVIGGFVFLATKDSEFVGQVISKPSTNSYTQCEAVEGLNTYDQDSNNGKYYGYICHNGLSHTCFDDSHGYVMGVFGDFYRCGYGSDNLWLACDSDPGLYLDNEKSSIPRHTEGILSNDKSYLCYSDQWFTCPSVPYSGDTVAKESGTKVGSYYCDGSKWIGCSQSNGILDDSNQFVCDFGDIVVCDSNKEGKMASDFSFYCEQDEWKACALDGELKGGEKYYCDKELNQWVSCGDSPFVFKNNPSFYCENEKWSVCSGSTDDTQKENTLLCQDSEWKTCSGNDVSANGHYKCNQNVWKKCEKNNEISGKFICKVDTWQPLESSKVAPTGYYWEKAPIPQSDLGNTVQIETQVYSDETPTGVKEIGICASQNYCAGGAYTDAPENNYCFAQDSVFNNKLCKSQEGETIWLNCDGSLQDNAVHVDGKWLCAYSQGKWRACNQKYNLMGDNQYYCDLSVSKWIQCDDEWDDQSSPDGNYACNEKKWSNEVNLGLNGFFEITLGEDENLDVNSPMNVYTSMYLCDPPNPPAFSVEVCDDQGTRSVNSVQHLKGTATNIHVEGDIVYVFEEEEPREVSLIYLVDIDELPLIDFATLGQNFEQGRRLAIRVYSTAAKDTYQIYMLSHDGANFDFKNLHLHLLPGMVEYENEQLTSDKHQFKIQATKVILIENLLDEQGIAQGKIKISLGKPELAIAGQLLDHDLENEFEVRLDRANPVRLTDFFSTELYVCQTDSDLQPKNMQICLPDPNTGEKNVPFVTLERDQLIKTTLNSKPVALLYQLVNGKKRASIFWLDDKVLDKTGFEVSQEFFILSMVASDKRMAVEFEDNLYLLDHSNGVVDLSSISLNTYQPFDDPTQGEPILTYPTESTNEIKIDVPVLGGKVYVEQLFGEPDATIKLSAKTNLQITSEPLSLLTEFSTSMSSQTSVAINQPTNFDIISRSLNDNQIVLNKFKLDLQGPKEEISLIQKEPQVIDNTLFYYYGSNGLIKGVKIHLLYDLKNKNVYDLTEEYSKSFLGGGELALKFGSSYYLVTHAADSVAFDFPKLQLTELITGAEQDVVESTTTSTTFQVAEGKVHIYEEDDEIHFEKITQDDLITTALGVDDHSFVLTPANKVELDDVVFDICGTGDAALKKEIVRVCKDGNKLEPMMLVDEQILDDKEDPKYLLWYHGLVSGEKTVTVHTIHELNPGVVSEVHYLTENLLALQTKAYLFDGTYFQLAGTAGDFSTYKLYSIPAGEKLALQNLKKSAYQVENGTYSYNQKLLFAQEKWGVDEQGKPTDNITLTLKPLLGKLVTSTGFNVTFTESALIVPAVGEPEYVLITQADVDNVKELADKLPKTVTVAIRDVEDEDNYYYYAKLPLGISTQVLLPNGKVVGIYVEDALGWLEREAKLNGVEVGDLADEDVGLPQITITK